MPISPEQLTRQLERELAPAYLVSGDEPLLADECADAIRARARAAGIEERLRFDVDAGFDWDRVREATHSLSLFSARRLIELRLPTGRPGEAGAALLAELAGHPAPDNVLLVRTGKLDKAQRDSVWVKALEAAGPHVAVRPLDASMLPAFLTQRLQAKGLKPEEGVVELLAWHLEGNLLAAAQEVDKLAMLIGQGTVRLSDVEQSLADSARFSIYQLVDAALTGDPLVTRRILARLRTEGTEPILILWTVAREVRSLASLKLEIARGRPESTVLARVWQSRRALVTRAVRRGTPAQWLGFARQCAQLDRILKGRARGDVWLEMESLLLALAGLQTFSVPRAAMEMHP